MNNDVNHVNYVKRALKNEQVVTLELFGKPIDCVDGTMRLKDVQDAYLNINPEVNYETSRFKEFTRNAKTRELIEYIEQLEGEDRYWGEQPPIDKPLGKRGGVYAIREIVHAYASWLDPRYAYHVNHAFDQLVQGNFERAHNAATKIAKPFVRMEWEARAERLTGLDMNPEDHFKFLVEDVFYEITGSVVDDPIGLRNYIYQNIGENLIFERLLNALELAWKYEDSDSAVKTTLDHFKDDPDLQVLIEVLKGYYEKNDIPWN